jgi:hypothetical protein
MAEESRLGREQIETAYALKQLVAAGVRMFFYLEDRERTLESPTDKVMLSLTTFADELERERARQRTYDAMVRRARAGHSTGGRTFGYRNQRVVDSISGRQSHVVREIDPQEAEVVRRIFELCASGSGYASIAKQLNADGALAPLPRRGTVQGWAASSVREILHRESYRGVLQWNRSRKRNAWGAQQQRARPATEWLHQSAPALRIVDEPLWESAQAQLARRGAVYRTPGKPGGRPANGIESRYLLTGFAACGLGTGSLEVRSRLSGTRRAHVYACATYHRRGPSVCVNRLVAALPAVDASVLDGLQRLLDPAVLRDAARLALDELDAPELRVAPRREAVAAELAQLDAELKRLAGAIAAGGSLPALVAAVTDRERRRATLQGELARLAPRGAAPKVNRWRALRELEEILANTRQLLAGQVGPARQVLRQLFPGRLMFTPRRDEGGVYYAFRGEAAIGRLFEGSILPQAGVSPTGFAGLWKEEFRGLIKIA